ncbi:ImmA/IrrE family metallo-endopeptidase [Glaciibacter flavus]|uniref:ImmA/IrrE family metallo-endopeptidase n=1 Tax=Orlajensenia flava TaxID=2565934 RepID=UPI003B00621F
MSARVSVAPSVLLWAQERGKREANAYEQKFPSWREWLDEKKAPTIKQVEEIAKYSHLPFGIFFLDEPPTVELPIPDYRLGRTGDDAKPSQELIDVIDLSIQRQAWFQDYALKNGIDRAEIVRASESDDPIEIAGLVASELGFTVTDRSRLKTRESARNHLRREIERRGGLVVITSMVGNNNHRMLDRGEFRGFTLADEQAPLIFVNSNDDSRSGQIFTILHEYGHVVLRSSGVSDEDPSHESSGVEDWCNALAAEVLVPGADLRTQFRPEVALEIELDRLASRYMASSLVILLKLRRLGLMDTAGFDALYRTEEGRAREAFLQQRARSGGGDFYANQPFRVGERLSRAVIGALREGGVSYTEAFRVLGLRNADQVNEYARQLDI